MIQTRPEVYLKRGFTIGFYWGLIVRYAQVKALEVPCVGELQTTTFDNNTLLFDQMYESIVMFGLARPNFEGMFAGLFQDDLFGTDKWSKDYTEFYHRLGRHYGGRLPIDNGSALAGRPNSPFAGATKKGVYN